MLPLRFTSGPDPLPLLLPGSEVSRVQPPAGGEPLLLLRRRHDVLRVLSERCATMAAVLPDGSLRHEPLTGAEEQSTDGGLLNMEGLAHKERRGLIASLFTPAAARAESLRAATTAACQIADAPPGTDLLEGFALPFCASEITRVLGIPEWSWDGVRRGFEMAFRLVLSPEDIAAVGQTWDELYEFYAKHLATADGVLGQVNTRLGRFSLSQRSATAANLANGFGAALPVIAKALAECLTRPELPALALSGEWTWDRLADHLIATVAMFPVALPRRLITRLDSIEHGSLPAGTLVLPSLIGASLDGPPDVQIPFGRGSPHFCPGAALTRKWTAVVLRAVFFARPGAVVSSSSLEWQAGTLSLPRELVYSEPWPPVPGRGIPALACQAAAADGALPAPS